LVGLAALAYIGFIAHRIRRDQAKSHETKPAE
jgi:hypothetical protein